MDSWTHFGFYNIFSKSFRKCFKAEKKFGKVRKNIFRTQKIFDFFRKKSFKNQWKFKKSKFRFFEKFSKFWFFIDFSLENYVSDFSEILFGLENFSKMFWKNIIKSKICSGIQKSYLENHTSILKLFKIKNPLFLTQILENPAGVTYTDP